MRIAQIRKMDISNGEGIGISLFTQGCRFHCSNCFNTIAWDFNGGKEWTQEAKNKVLELANQDYISRLSILGGEPLEPENLNDLFDLIESFKERYPNKKIWLYSGFTWYQLFEDDEFDLKAICENQLRRAIVLSCDVFVDGRYIDELRDLNLKYKGSSNQNVIDVQQSLEQHQIVLYCD